MRIAALLLVVPFAPSAWAQAPETPSSGRGWMRDLSRWDVARNMGHRTGADVVRHAPENSLAMLTRVLGRGPDGLPPLQDHRHFHYLEFDVRETADGELVVFHDSALRRMLPNKGRNAAVYTALLADRAFTKRTGYAAPGDFHVHGMRLDELRRFRFPRAPLETVPTLEEYLSLAGSLGLRKPMAAEIKRLMTDGARDRLVSILGDFRRSQARLHPGLDDPVAILAYPGAFRASFFPDGDPSAMRRWCRKLVGAGLLNARTPLFHADLCRPSAAPGNKARRILAKARTSLPRTRARCREALGVLLPRAP